MTKAKLWFWILMNAVLVTVVLIGLGFVMPTLLMYERSLAPARTITVTAQGKTTATPDLAEINFSVLTQGQNPQTLSTSNNDKMNAVLDFVSAQGIASSDIKTTGYDLQPNYKYDEQTQRNFIVGYTLTQTVTTKIRDLNKVATVLGGLAPLGVNQIGGVNFTFADPEARLAIARADAILKAQTKAWQMANQAGVWLGRAVNITENGNFPQPYYLNGDFSKAATAGGASAPSIQPGTQDVTDSVSITYSIQ
jgi:uncharacterized protein YggE